jgi:DNA-binding MarR family transcriptional regulator
VDSRILTEFGPRIGPHALAIYLALARFADNTTRTCYPSVPTVARLTGMSRPTATKALRTLEKAGLISIKRRRTPSGDPSSHEYTLLRLPEHGEAASPWVVNEVDRGAKTPFGGVSNDVGHPPQGGFHELNLLNKTQDNYTEGSVAAPPRRPAAQGRDPTLDHPAVRAYHELCKLTPNEMQRAEIAAAVHDTVRWQEVIQQWLLTGYRKTNVAGMLDWYKHGIPERGHGFGSKGGGLGFGSFRGRAVEQRTYRPLETPEEQARRDAEWAAIVRGAKADSDQNGPPPESR